MTAPDEPLSAEPDFEAADREAQIWSATLVELFVRERNLARAYLALRERLTRITAIARDNRGPRYNHRQALHDIAKLAAPNTKERGLMGLVKIVERPASTNIQAERRADRDEAERIALREQIARAERLFRGSIQSDGTYRIKDDDDT